MPVRSEFTRERLDQLAAAGGTVALTDDDLATSRADALRSHPAGSDLWVFAYGSLMWNPAIAVVESQPATVAGWQRSFCIDLPGGRGSADRPGLMCALVPSGRCHGVGLRIAAADIESETTILWLREMAFGAYRASLLPLTIGGLSVDGLVFAAQPSLVVELDLEEQARRIAHAEGPVGTNRDYLFRLADALRSHDLEDPYVTSLAARVRERHTHSGGMPPG
ncbi:gamma-glutamylcyclotransferase [Intrasporangium mesophilum]